MEFFAEVPDHISTLWIPGYAEVFADFTVGCVAMHFGILLVLH